MGTQCWAFLQAPPLAWGRSWGLSQFSLSATPATAGTGPTVPMGCSHFHPYLGSPVEARRQKAWASSWAPSPAYLSPGCVPKNQFPQVQIENIRAVEGTVPSINSGEPSSVCSCSPPTGSLQKMAQVQGCRASAATSVPLLYSLLQDGATFH